MSFEATGMGGIRTRNPEEGLQSSTNRHRGAGPWEAQEAVTEPRHMQYRMGECSERGQC